MTYQTILTAAADSRPVFQSAGFHLPRPLIRLRGAPIIISAISSYCSAAASAVVAINELEQQDWPIRETIHQAFPRVRVMEVPSAVKGALATAVISAGPLDRAKPVVVAAGDSSITGGIAPAIHWFQERDLAGGTIVFRAQEPRWSYVVTDDVGRVTQIVEKQVVSELATTGVFYFRSLAQFLDAAKWCFLNRASTQGQYYVSAALNYLLMEGHSVGFMEIERKSYHPASLPADLVPGADV